jgi:hypothetical protein
VPPDVRKGCAFPKVLSLDFGERLRLEPSAQGRQSLESKGASLPEGRRPSAHQAAQPQNKFL